MSIRQAMEEYAARSLKRWHTPGHKGGLDPLDLTEIGEGEIFPSDRIERAESAAAEFYGAKRCRFLLGGSSMGIKAAVMSAGGDILAPKARHRSADEGATLARVRLIEIDSERSDDGLYDPPTPDEVYAAVCKNKSARAVLIVSPDYYGRTAEKETADIVARAGMFFIADSAHGAHFAARKDLFENGFYDVADLCVMSAHKTLNAPTMCSLMTCNNSSLFGVLDRNLRLLGTTSPSYPMLAATEEAIAFAKQNAGGYDGLKAAAERLRERVRCRKSDDFTRITVNAYEYGQSGKELFERLLKLGHAAEMYDDKRVVFIATLADTPKDLDSLCRALQAAGEKRKEY